MGRPLAAGSRAAAAAGPCCGAEPAVLQSRSWGLWVLPVLDTQRLWGRWSGGLVTALPIGIGSHAMLVHAALWLRCPSEVPAAPAPHRRWWGPAEPVGCCRSPAEHGRVNAPHPHVFPLSSWCRFATLMRESSILN